MRIKTLFLSLSAAGVALISVSAWLFWSAQSNLLQATHVQQVINDIEREGIQLAAAVDRSLMRPAADEIRRLQAQQTKLSSNIGAATHYLADHAPYTRYIQFTLSGMALLSQQLLENLSVGSTTEQALKARTVLVSQFRLRSAELSSAVNSLDEISDSRINEILGRINQGFYFRLLILLTAMIAFGILLYLVVLRRVLFPLAKLQSLIGAERIASIESFVALHAHDEFGEVGSTYSEALRQRRLYEQRAGQLLEQFQATFEQAAVGIAHVAPDGHWLRVNQRLCEICGYTHAEMLQLTFQDITHPDDLQADLDLVERTLAGKIPNYAMEKRYIRKDGVPVWVNLTVSMIRKQDGSPDYFVSVIEDIDARKSAEVALSDAGRIAHLGRWQLDIATGRAVWSQEIHDIFGTNESQPVGPEFLRQMVVSEDWQAVEDSMQLAINTGAAHTVEYRIRRPDNEERWIYCRANRETDSQGHPLRLVGIAQDITERKRLERELQQTRKLEALGRLTGGIAHDFNNILAAMLGFAELSRDRLELLPREKLAHYLDTIIESGLRGRDLVAQMLTFSGGQPQQEARPLDLCEATREVVRLLGSTLPSSIEVSLETEQELPQVVISKAQYHQVLMNLCLNARDAMAGRGRLAITVSSVSLNSIECAVCNRFLNGPWIAVKVADSGSGIDKKLLPRIFDPFFTSKAVGEGSGLGLSVIVGIMRAVGGHILVTTELGVGSQFVLLFEPSSRRLPQTGAADQPVVAAVTGAGYSLLVVDDEAALADYYGELLEARGYRVTSVTDSLEALALLSEGATVFDLVITDQTMPRLTGVELINAVHAISPELPMILCSGYSDVVDEERAASLGISRFLSKPVNAETLLKAVAEVIGRHNSPLQTSPRH